MQCTTTMARIGEQKGPWGHLREAAPGIPRGIMKYLLPGVV